MKRKFFVFNPKSYLYGDSLLELAKHADEIAAEVDMDVYVTCPYADIYPVAHATENIIVSAQHVDGLEPGRGIGAVLAESVYSAGARATFLNHAEKPMLLSDLAKSIKRCKNLGIRTIVCADSIQEAQAIAIMGPDIILCEPTELIGTGETSDDTYVESTNNAIKEINPEIQVMQAAGISTPEDVQRVMELGADGTGCTSGIVKANDPKQMLEDMILKIANS